MKNLLTVNPEVNNAQTKAMWYGGIKAQELYAMLINVRFEFDAFCMEEKEFDTFLSKRALSIFELIEEQDYALILSVEDYETVLDKYERYGLERDRVFVWTDPRLEIIYV
ncbi:MAG: hypothetical protein NC398_06280 [Acetatifactor muris]|nr:hypothetical protein [Acetatifactor muris]MCM1526644.1 hypothetical protein [Bacteroides sp.]